MTDTKKLTAFMDAALTNPRHPLYSIGYAKSRLVQDYALMCRVLENVTPEQFWTDYPHYAQRVEEAIRLCETPEVEAPAVEPEPEPEPDKPAEEKPEEKPEDTETADEPKQEGGE